MRIPLCFNQIKWKYNSMSENIDTRGTDHIIHKCNLSFKEKSGRTRKQEKNA
jgi:hypothetical protein